MKSKNGRSFELDKLIVVRKVDCPVCSKVGFKGNYYPFVCGACESCILKRDDEFSPTYILDNKIM